MTFSLSRTAPDFQDVGTQRCRLGPGLMTKMSLQIGECVKITTANKVFLCHAWPRKDLFEEYIEIDETVSKALSNTEGTVACHGFTRRNEKKIFHIEKIHCQPLAKVEVTVIVSNIEDLHRFKNENQSKECLKGVIKELLLNRSVMPNFVFDCAKMKLAKLKGIHLITIDSISAEDISAGLVLPSTQICLVNIKSKLWYDNHNQMQQNSNKHLLGGLDEAARMLEELVSLPVKYPVEFQKLGLEFPKGILLHGPSGCGKTSLVRSVCIKSEACLICIQGPEILGSRPGESEENLRDIFSKAKELSTEGPCILFIDEIDSICPTRGKSGSTQEGRIVSQLLMLMDDLDSTGRLVVIAATNRPSALDPSLRRPGRFDREVLIGIPTQNQRYEILKVNTQGLPLDDDVDLHMLSEATKGYVGADLALLCQEAAYTALPKVFEQPKLGLTMSDLKKALGKITPSTQKGSDIFVDHRVVSWEDIGGLTNVKKQMIQAVEWPLKYPDSFRRLGLPHPKGVLLYGPPGCSKTLLVRAAASACGATFLAVSGAQLFSSFVGDSEKALSETFNRARMSAPSILFLDEIDSIIGKRSESSSGRGVQERVLSTLLNEMDGVGVKVEERVCQSREREIEGQGEREIKEKSQKAVDNSEVLVVAATNRPDMLDDALLRPGRLDKIIYVPPPDLQARKEILKIHCKNMPVFELDVDVLAEQTQGWTGADLENLCREVALHVLTEEGLEASVVSQEHFEQVLKTLKPSLTTNQLAMYTKCKPTKY